MRILIRAFPKSHASKNILCSGTWLLLLLLRTRLKSWTKSYNVLSPSSRQIKVWYSVFFIVVVVVCLIDFLFCTLCVHLDDLFYFIHLFIYFHYPLLSAMLQLLNIMGKKLLHDLCQKKKKLTSILKI